MPWVRSAIDGLLGYSTRRLGTRTTCPLISETGASRCPTNWVRVTLRAELAQHVATSPAPLQPFGSAQSQRTVSNDFGVVVLGFDGPEPEPIATRLSQVFLSGEIWGLNRILVEPRRTEPMRTFQIPWPG